MAQTIRNQANLTYLSNGRTQSALSNVATAQLAQPLSIDKRSLQDTYRAGDELTFVLSAVNNGSAALNNLILRDDLGTYNPGTGSVTPLTFAGPAQLFLNGIFSRTILPTITGSSLTFTLPTLAPGAAALILYQARVNEYAPLSAGSPITNTVTASDSSAAASVTASNTVTAEAYADVSVTKTMSPAVLVQGSQMTYQFLITNAGNAEATNIVLTDAFSPAPADISVFLNGDLLDPTAYTYLQGILTLPAAAGESLSLPPASITRDPATGVVTAVPSALEITVVGTL